jgi:hypothetical protein
MHVLENILATNGHVLEKILTMWQEYFYMSKNILAMTDM